MPLMVTLAMARKYGACDRGEEEILAVLPRGTPGSRLFPLSLVLDTTNAKANLDWAIRRLVEWYLFGYGAGREYVNFVAYFSLLLTPVNGPAVDLKNALLSRWQGKGTDEQLLQIRRAGPDMMPHNLRFAYDFYVGSSSRPPTIALGTVPLQQIRSAFKKAEALFFPDPAAEAQPAARRAALGENYHVQPDKDGSWRVVREGAKRATNIHVSSVYAKKHAIQLARKTGGKVYIHKADGSVSHTTR